MQLLALALIFGLSAAQSLSFAVTAGALTGLPAGCERNITVTGGKSVLSWVCEIPAGATVDLGGREFDRGQDCDERDTGTTNAVFALGAGATIRNGIIGNRQSEGIHCRGACNIRNIWFRDVCEDAITALGSGTVLIEGGGAQSAGDKVVQANGPGEVIIRDYTVVDVGKVYRSCGNCSNNSGRSPRRVTIQNLRARDVRTNVVGINDNFGDIATLSGMCGTVRGEVCQQFDGINGPGGDSNENAGKQNCRGAQGTAARGSLPACSG